MDLGNLTTFLAVYESGSMAKAAKVLYMSPQGLSKSILRLEGELGVPLFVRTARGVEPTKYAHDIYPKAQALAAALQSVRTEGRRAESFYVLNVSFSDGMIAYLGLDFISAFEREHPGIELRVSECSNKAIEDFLLSGESEVGFLIGPVNDELFQTSFFQAVPHVLMVSDQSQLTYRDSIEYRDLEGATVFCLGQDYPVERTLRERLQSAGVNPASIIGVVGADTVLPFVMRDEGVLLSAAYWAELSSKPGLRVVPFRDESFAWNVFVATKKGAAPSEAAASFIEFIEDWQRKLRDDEDMQNG